jgi:hypothetical protein
MAGSAGREFHQPESVAVNEPRRSQAERSEEREAAVRKQDQAIHESRLAARRRHPGDNLQDELMAKSRRRRELILKAFLVFLLLGIGYAVVRGVTGSKNPPGRRVPATEEGDSPER